MKGKTPSRARGDPEHCKRPVKCKRSLHRRAKCPDALTVCGDDLEKADVSGSPAISQQHAAAARTRAVASNGDNAVLDSDILAAPQASPQQSQKAFAIEGVILTSGIHFSGAAFAIWNHFAQFGITLASESEAVGLAMLGLSAALSGMTFATAFKMMPFSPLASK